MGRCWAIMLGVFVLAACSSEPQGARVVARSTASLSDFEFASELARCEEVTLEEALRLLHLSVVEGGGYDPVAARQSACELGWVGQDQKLGDVMTYGQAGRLYAGLCNLEGNLFLKIFGSSERYGLRECQRLGLLDAANPGQKVPGSVLMTAQSQADEHLRQAGEDSTSPLARFKAALKITEGNTP